MSQITVSGAATKHVGVATIAAAVSAVVLSSFVETAEASTPALTLIQLGGPVALGAAVANILYYPVQDPQSRHQLTSYVIRGAIAGATATAILMYAGAMPVAFDTQTLAFVGLVAGATAIGDAVAVLDLI